MRMLGRSIGKFGKGKLAGVGAFGRIALVGGIMFLAVKRPDLFVWWAALVGFFCERVSMGIAVILPDFWPIKRG